MRWHFYYRPFPSLIKSNHLIMVTLWSRISFGLCRSPSLCETGKTGALNGEATMFQVMIFLCLFILFYSILFYPILFYSILFYSILFYSSSILQAIRSLVLAPYCFIVCGIALSVWVDYGRVIELHDVGNPAVAAAGSGRVQNFTREGWGESDIYMMGAKCRSIEARPKLSFCLSVRRYVCPCILASVQ